MMLSVFRVQDESGRGPFKPGFTAKWVISRSDHKNLIPSFIEFKRLDIKVVPGCTYGCACRKITQLRRWFTKPEYRKLKKLGYKAYKIKVDEIIADSDIQCIAVKKSSFTEDAEKIKLY
jgi:hypothetical protein